MGWNDLFWALHHGLSRTVLREYGNMLGATVIFVLDEQRRRMEEDEEGADWGVMMGFGPGFTIETMVLHASSNLKKKC